MDKGSKRRGSWVRETHLQRPRCKELGEFGKLKFREGGIEGGRKGVKSGEAGEGRGAGVRGHG